MSDSPETGWQRFDNAAFGIIYGAIIVLSILLAQGGHTASPLETAVVLFGSVLAITLAKSFAELLSHALGSRERMVRGSWRAAWRHSWPTFRPRFSGSMAKSDRGRNGSIAVSGLVRRGVGGPWWTSGMCSGSPLVPGAARGHLRRRHRPASCHRQTCHSLTGHARGGSALVSGATGFPTVQRDIAAHPFPVTVASWVVVIHSTNPEKGLWINRDAQ